MGAVREPLKALHVLLSGPRKEETCILTREKKGAITLVKLMRALVRLAKATGEDGSKMNAKISVAGLTLLSFIS